MRGLSGRKTDRLDKVLLGLFMLLSVVLAYPSSGWVTFPLIALIFVMSLRVLPQYWPRRRLRAPIAALMFALAFLLVAIAFIISAKTPKDLAYIFNFTLILLLGPLTASLRRFAAPGNTLLVSALALLGCLIAVVIAAYQVVVEGSQRASGFSDPIWSAQAVIVIGFLALLGFATTESRWRFAFLLAPILATGVAVLSGSRGPLLAVPVLIAIFVGLNGRHRMAVVGASIIGLALVGFATFLFWPAAFERLVSLPRLASELVTGNINETSGSERQLMYRTSLPAFLDAPWFGHGWAHMLEAIAPYLPNGLATFRQVHLHLHSDLLDFAISGGVLGLIAYGLLIAAPVAGSIASPRDSQWTVRLTAALILSTGYFVFGLTYLLFGYEYHTTLYVALAAIVLGFCTDGTQPAPDARTQPSPSRDGEHTKYEET